ncbi:hypothetical protein WA158_007029 [Blastocystis sp. Blastoise]
MLGSHQLHTPEDSQGSNYTPEDNSQIREMIKRDTTIKRPASSKFVDDDDGLSSRKKKSLHHLTTEFVKLVKMQPDGSIDVVSASQSLGVEKRRIYDITNALIGANLLRKKGKSVYCWIGNELLSSLSPESQALYNEENTLIAESQALDLVYNQLNSQIDSIKKDKKLIKYAYITKSQLMQTFTNKNQTIFALMGTPGTDVQTSCDINDDGSKSYELYLCSTQGPLEAYLVHYVDTSVEGETTVSNENTIHNVLNTTPNTMSTLSTIPSHHIMEDPLLNSFFPPPPSQTPTAARGLSQDMYDTQPNDYPNSLLTLDKVDSQLFTLITFSI